MAGDPRPTPDALELEERLREAPWRFDFFQALRRLECAHRERPRIGEAVRLRDEYLRLGQDPSLAFAPSTLASFETDGARPPRLGVYFLGLFGPNGPLPLHLTEYARDRMRNSGDRTFARFADVFHHRMLSLFYRAWAQAQPAVSFDRPERDRFGDYVGSLLGIGMPELGARDAAPDIAKRYYAGRFSLQTRNADGLRDVLSDYFEVPVEIEEFRGAWLEIPEPERLRLGESLATGSLGVSTIVGSRVWDRQLSFRAVCGPMGLPDYERLLPDRSSLQRMAALVRTYIGEELVWDCQLVLVREEVPATRLGGRGRLGWTTWLLGEPAARDADDLVLHPAHLPAPPPTPLQAEA
jgi:type VI secretion system protein ImpH